MATLNPNVYRFDLPCPHCDQVDQLLIGELVDKDEIACRYCEEMIDLTNAELQARLRDDIEGYREIDVIKK